MISVKDKKGIFSLLGLLLATMVVVFLSYILLTAYFKKPAIEKETEEILVQQGIDSSSYQSILDSTKQQIEQIEQIQADRSRDILEQMQGKDY